LIYIALSFRIQKLVQYGSVEILTTFTILIALCLALQDIAVDAYVLKVLSSDCYSYGSSIETIARVFGIALTFPIFLHTSLEVRWLCVVVGLYSMIIGFMMLFVEEEDKGIEV